MSSKETWQQLIPAMRAQAGTFFTRTGGPASYSQMYGEKTDKTGTVWRFGILSGIFRPPVGGDPHLEDMPLQPNPLPHAAILVCVNNSTMGTDKIEVHSAVPDIRHAIQLTLGNTALLSIPEDQRKTTFNGELPTWVSAAEVLR